MEYENENEENEVVVSEDSFATEMLNDLYNS